MGRSWFPFRLGVVVVSVRCGAALSRACRRRRFLDGRAVAPLRRPISDPLRSQRRPRLEVVTDSSLTLRGRWHHRRGRRLGHREDVGTRASGLST
jgi:hypothetical protein